MKNLLSSNSYFLVACLLFFIFGGVLLFQIEKPDSLIFFSERRTDFLDFFFSYTTKMGEELMYLFFLIVLLFVKIRYAILIPITGLLVSGISHLLKSFFKHDRPLMFLRKLRIEEQINYVEGIELYVGPTSFPSGHTMSAFALYGIVAMVISIYGSRVWGILLFVIALLIGVSRIYLVQHFFQDVYLGAWIGVILAILIFWFQGKILQEESHWVNRSIIGKGKPIA